MLCNDSMAPLKVNQLQETRAAVRQTVATVEVNGRRGQLAAAAYNLPTTTAGLRIDCAATKGFADRSTKKNAWGLVKDARLGERRMSSYLP